MHIVIKFVNVDVEMRRIKLDKMESRNSYSILPQKMVQFVDDTSFNEKLIKIRQREKK